MERVTIWEWKGKGEINWEEVHGVRRVEKRQDKRGSLGTPSGPENGPVESSTDCDVEGAGSCPTLILVARTSA